MRTRNWVVYTAMFWAWTNLLFGMHSITAYAQNSTPAAPDAPAAEAAEPTAPESYIKLTEAFMAGRSDEISDLLTAAQRDTRHLDADQRKVLTDIRRIAPHMPPKWWPATRSTSNVSFPAEMWGRRFNANYIPSDILGMQQPVDVRNNRLVVVVTWRPAFVDNPRPLQGWLAEKHGLTQGDLGEVIVWHELGHNYVTLNLNYQQAMELYNNHYILFTHVQEFYADLTALRHSSPKAARTTLMFRLRELTGYNERDAHTRAAHGLGALLLSEWLENPDKWPMIHFPPTVPDTEVELNTIRYIYQNMATEWSVEEYFALQSFIDTWVKAHGNNVLRGRGLVRMNNRQQMMLVEPDDRQMQAEREKWVTEKLTKIIADGRADKEAPQPENRVIPGYFTGIQIPW